MNDFELKFEPPEAVVHCPHCPDGHVHYTIHDDRFQCDTCNKEISREDYAALIESK